MLFIFILLSCIRCSVQLHFKDHSYVNFMTYKVCILAQFQEHFKYMTLFLPILLQPFLDYCLTLHLVYFYTMQHCVMCVKTIFSFILLHLYKIYVMKNCKVLYVERKYFQKIRFSILSKKSLTDSLTLSSTHNVTFSFVDHISVLDRRWKCS